MSASLRKLIGSVCVLVFLAGYIWLAATIAERLPDNGGIRLAYFAAVGILWGVPILPLISWMNRGR